MKSDFYDVLVEIHAETAMAVRVSESGEDSDGIWLPKSQIEIDRRPDNYAEITLPQWLAEDKGLV